MRYNEITKPVIKEDATAGATASASVATVAAPFFTNPTTTSKKPKKPVVLKRS
jgi:hypothetical protein